jgi:hypothetical protein
MENTRVSPSASRAVTVVTVAECSATFSEAVAPPAYEGNADLFLKRDHMGLDLRK